MIFIKIFRFLCGYICFCIDGGFPERFINLCAASSVALWDLEKHDGKIFAKTNIKSYKKIRKPAKKSSVKVRIISKSGLPFLIRKNRDRKFLLIGAILFVAGIIFLSNTVWTIKIVGNQSVTDEEIISALSELGLDTGVRISEIDRKNISKNLRNKIDSLTWAAVNIEGCTATVEVKEKLDTAEPEDDSTEPSNVVALHGGVLTYIEAYQGTRIQEIGSGVLKGDVIISGIVEYKTIATNFYHAEGYVEAKTERKISVNTKPLNGYKYDKIKTSSKLLIFGLEIPLTPKPQPQKNSDCFTSRSFLKIGDTILPFGLEKTTVSCYSKTKINEPLYPVTKLICRQTNDFSHLKILSRDISVSEAQLSADYTCLENIASQGKLEVEFTQENEN